MDALLSYNGGLVQTTVAGLSNHDVSADCLKLVNNTKMSEYNLAAKVIYAMLGGVLKPQSIS